MLCERFVIVVQPRPQGLPREKLPTMTLVQVELSRGVIGLIVLILFLFLIGFCVGKTYRNYVYKKDSSQNFLEREKNRNSLSSVWSKLVKPVPGSFVGSFSRRGPWGRG